MNHKPEKKLELNSESGLVSGASHHPSPNFDDRPDGTQIDVLVVHAISLPPRCYGSDHIEQLFTNQLDPEEHRYFSEIHTLRVSSHFLINRVGKITQFVSTKKRAWHAGVSCFGGREQVNDFSIGIELEGCDEDEFEDAQYTSLIDLTKCLIRSYPSIEVRNIVGHCDIAPERKTDPGPLFDWGRYLTGTQSTTLA